MFNNLTKKLRNTLNSNNHYLIQNLYFLSTTPNKRKEEEKPYIANIARADGSVTRAYKEVAISKSKNNIGYNVLLDKRILKTPLKKPLEFPTEALALAIAAEWEWQDTRKIHPITMPMMTLASTAVDRPKPRQFIISEITNYGFTDPAVCRYTDTKLRKKQLKHYEPLIFWANNFFGSDFFTSEAIMGSEQPEATLKRVETFLAGLDWWNLVCLQSMVIDCKSLIIGCALFNDFVSIEKAVELARLEEDDQIEGWGLVEGGHDLDICYIKMKLAAASVFVKLLKIQS